jgi:hypothetical protein
MALNLNNLTRLTQPEPQLPDASRDDPEIIIRKEQHRVNSERAYFWGKVSQLTFWGMTAVLIGSGAMAAVLGTGGAAISTTGILSFLGLATTLGATSLITGRIENRIRVDNSLNFEEIHAKNIGRHTGQQVANAIASLAESRETERSYASTPAIPVAIARDGSSSQPQSRIDAKEAISEGRTAQLPPGVTLH